jgi:hypothetical protein
MALAAMAPFPGIETAHPGHRGALDTLAVQAPRRGLFMTAAFLSQPGVQPMM